MLNSNSPANASKEPIPKPARPWITSVRKYRSSPERYHTYFGTARSFAKSHLYTYSSSHPATH